MTKYIVNQGFTLNLDDGRSVDFTPGQTIPAEFADHWYVQGQVGTGYVSEEGRVMPGQDGPLVGGQEIGGDSIPYSEVPSTAEAAQLRPRDGVMLDAAGNPLSTAPEGHATALNELQLEAAQAELVGQGKPDEAEKLAEEAKDAKANDEAAPVVVQPAAPSSNRERNRGR